jgi:hypothetical protein
MKRYFWLLCLLLLVLPFQSWAASPNFLIMDQTNDRLMIIGSDLKQLNSYSTGPDPTALEPIPDNNGYLLMCRGTKNWLGQSSVPGQLVYLDMDLRPTTKKIALPGLITQDFFLKQEATWIFVTAAKSHSQAAVNILNLKTGIISRFDLNSAPMAYQFNADHSNLAVTTLGATDQKVSPQLVLIDLHDLKMKSFPVAANPGAIYFVNEHKIVVACGGFRDSFNFITNTSIEPLDKSIHTSLHWIDTASGNEQITTLGYSPLVIIQDQNDPNTFYAASIDKNYDQIVNGTFYKFTNGENSSKVKFTGEPVKLIQTKPGNICLLGKNEFYLIDPKDSKIILNLNYTLSVDHLFLNQDNTVGYLSVSNSNYMDKIDITSGKLIEKLTIGSSLFGGILSLDGIFPSKSPLVSGMVPPTDGRIDYSVSNNRNIITSDFNRLYSLNGSSEVRGIDLTTGKQVTSTKFFQGKPYGIHLMPNGKFIAVVTDSAWYLLDPNQKKPLLTISTIDENELNASEHNKWKGNGDTGYYNSNGTILVIPSNGSFYIVDCENCKLVSKIRANIQRSTIIWLP